MINRPRAWWVIFEKIADHAGSQQEATYLCDSILRGLLEHGYITEEGKLPELFDD